MGGENIKCMKKIGLLFLLLAIGTIAFSQEITVRFTGQLNNSEYCRLDSVKITNLTRNWTETVEYPDTIIVLGGTVDANMNITTIQGLVQNVPNPFNCETRAELSVSQQENVRMQLLDATGKLCAEYYSSLDAGVHNFDISASMPHTYMLNAMVGSRSYSIRMVNVGRGSGNSIRYAGISGGITAKLTSTNDFQIGDNMRYEGYTTIEEQIVTSETIEQMQAVNQYVNLNFTYYFRPIVETLSATDITTATATLHGDITNDGGSYCVSRGFYYGTSEDNLSQNVIASDTDNSFSYMLEGLIPSTTYYYKAYATNVAGLDVGEIMSFTTADIIVPTVHTSEASVISRTSVTLNAVIDNNGGSEILSCGFYYGADIEDLSNQVIADVIEDNFSETINVIPNTTYYYKAYATNIVGTSYGEVLSFNTTGGTLNGHNWVDLGLPSGTYWATTNVGANNPEDYGEYFAWGETSSKEIYEWTNYIYSNGSSTTLTKYCDNPDLGNNGFTDNLTTLEAIDDAATTNWGVGWRMPTMEEFTELYDNCTQEWTTQNGINGRTFTGPNGNSIFLPAAGRRENGDILYVGSNGIYWSNSLVHPCYAGCLGFSLENSDVTNAPRIEGLSVRPVCTR